MCGSKLWPVDKNIKKNRIKNDYKHNDFIKLLEWIQNITWEIST